MFGKQQNEPNYLESFDAYQSQGNMRIGGKLWHFGIADNEAGELDDKPILRAMACCNGAVFVLDPLLLDEHGRVEDYRFERLNTNGASRGYADPSTIPEPVKQRLLDITAQHRLGGKAGFLSAKLSEQPEGSSTPQVFSHTIRIDKTSWNVYALSTNDGDQVAGAMRNNNGDPRDRMPHTVMLWPTDITESGKIKTYVFGTQSTSQEWEQNMGENLPPRLVTELTRFAERLYLFGTSQESWDKKIDTATERALQDSDPDHEMAQLMLHHHSAEMDEFLDYYLTAQKENPSLTLHDLLEDEQKGQLAEAATHTAAYRQAAQVLKKPASHADRLKLQREIGPRNATPKH